MAHTLTPGVQPKTVNHIEINMGIAGTEFLHRLFRQDDERGLTWGAIALSANWPTLPIWPF
jgi:hypothetical protein